MKKCLLEKYRNFAREVKSSNRFFPSSDSNNFLSDLKKIVEERAFSVDEGQTLYRARLNNIPARGRPQKSAKLPRDADEMIPKPNMKSEGRVNAYNTTVLYLTSTPEAAIAEVRPENHQPVTVAEFSVRKPLRLADFVSERPNWHWYFYPGANDLSDLLIEIGGDLSRPIRREDTRLDYLPTQVIAEFVRSLGFDGLVYQSQFNARQEHSEQSENIVMNFALFDCNTVSFINSAVWKITKQIIVVQKTPIEKELE